MSTLRDNFLEKIAGVEYGYWTYKDTPEVRKLMDKAWTKSDTEDGSWTDARSDAFDELDNQRQSNGFDYAKGLAWSEDLTDKPGVLPYVMKHHVDKGNYEDSYGGNNNNVLDKAQAQELLNYLDTKIIPHRQSKEYLHLQDTDELRRKLTEVQNKKGITGVLAKKFTEHKLEKKLTRAEKQNASAKDSQKWELETYQALSESLKKDLANPNSQLFNFVYY